MNICKRPSESLQIVADNNQHPILRNILEIIRIRHSGFAMIYSMMHILITIFLLFPTTPRAEGLLSGLVSTPLLLPVVISRNQLSLDSYVIRPDRPGRFPLVIIVHGTPSVDGPAFFRAIADRSPVTYNKAAIAFAKRGYATVSIMRRGFGRSGGTYAEALQHACDYLPAVRASAEDVMAALVALRQVSWADADRVVLLGHSTGALAVLATAAENPIGVVGIINFDGGRHGRASPGEPCPPENLIGTMAALGRTARVPALWIYAENDQSYDPALAQRMFSAYVGNGAPAQMDVLPPFGTDGHDTVVAAPTSTWFPSVSAFLDRLSLPIATIIALPPLVPLAPPPGAVPVCQRAFADYVTNRTDAKAFAITAQGGCGMRSARTIADARQGALANCQAHNPERTCKLYASGQSIIQN